MKPEQPVPQEFETKTCSRCAGTGHYSYCQMYGTTCFKCRGAKVVYTKRGLAARQYYDVLRSKPAGEFRVGELIYIEPGMFNKGGFTAVTEIKFVSAEERRQRGERSSINGVEIELTNCITIKTKLLTLAGLSTSDMQKRGLSKEEKQIILQKAYAYQAILTKSGTPRKSKESKK